MNKKDNIHLIGIVGKIGAGKDLVGTIIQYIYYCRNKNININYTGFDNYINNSRFEEYWEIKKFADKLKDCVCLILGCSRQMLEDRNYKETELGDEWWYYIAKDNKTPLGLITLEEYDLLNENQKDYLKLFKLTPRLILQILGTDCARKIIHPNIWVNSLMSEYKEKNGYPNWIITDVRFPNEAKAIKAKNGIIIKINRYNNLIETSGIQQHASEIALDNYDFDYVIENNGTIEDLIFKINKII
jgi:hypothetical protein